MRRVAAAVAAFFFGFLLLGQAEAGWVVHSKNTGSRGKAIEDASYFERKQIRMEIEDSAHVMNFDTRKIIWIMKKEGKYSVMTFEEFKKMMRESMKASQQIMEEMKQKGISLPGASSRPQGKVTVGRLPGATIAGYGCDGYRVSVGGDPQEDIWVTRKIGLMKVFDPAVWKEFADFSGEMKSMGPGSPDYGEASEYRKIAEGGFPMKTVDKKSGSVREVIRVEKKAIASSMFEEPKGLKKVPFDKLMSGSSRGMPSSGEMPAWQGQTMPPGMEKPAKEIPAASPPGAKQPAQEKKGDVLDGIPEGAKEGIKKLFNW
ncbi:MAG: DUF4412 domain-containing protein [Candidatus Deferrimicrobiaceae bacterium]